MQFWGYWWFMQIGRIIFNWTDIHVTRQNYETSDDAFLSLVVAKLSDLKNSPFLAHPEYWWHVCSLCDNVYNMYRPLEMTESNAMIRPISKAALSVSASPRTVQLAEAKREWSVYILWICFPHSVRYQGKRKTKPYSIFPITAFNMKRDERLTNLFQRSFLRAKCKTIRLPFSSSISVIRWEKR